MDGTRAFSWRKNVLRMAEEQIPPEEIARELSITKEEVEKILE